jgi:hypothetical protein
MTAKNERHFTRRVGEFWKRFSGNEARLAGYAGNIGEYGGEDLILADEGARELLGQVRNYLERTG